MNTEPIVTPAVVRRDIENVRKRFRLMDEPVSLDMDAAAGMALQMVRVARDRLDDQQALRTLYLDNREAVEATPSVVMATVQMLVSGEITREQAEDVLSKAEDEYRSILAYLGFKPKRAEGGLMPGKA